jgi:hypothetical protein
VPSMPFAVVLPGPRLARQNKRMSGARPIGRTRMSQHFELRAPVFKTYSLQSEAVPMPRAAQGVPWATFKWVVGILLGAIGVLAAGGFTWMHGDIGDIRKEISDTRKDTMKEISETRVGLAKEIAETRIEVTRFIGAVQTQIATTNTKLDDILSEMRRQR